MHTFACCTMPILLAWVMAKTNPPLVKLVQVLLNATSAASWPVPYPAYPYVHSCQLSRAVLKRQSPNYYSPQQTRCCPDARQVLSVPKRCPGGRGCCRLQQLVPFQSFPLPSAHTPHSLMHSPGALTQCLPASHAGSS